jgi:anti-sigma B factor antagonist
MSELAHVEIEPGDEAWTVYVRGEIDISNAARLLATIEERMSNDTPAVTVDLSATTYLDSAGVQMLFVLAERLRDRRHPVRVIVPERSPIRAVLELTGLPTFVPMESGSTPVESNP